MKLLYSVSETAGLLGISRRTIYNWISQRRFIRPRWIGRKPMFHVDDINRYLEDLPRSGPCDSRP
jgi:excisionase family DNA binding protein